MKSDFSFSSIQRIHFLYAEGKIRKIVDYRKKEIYEDMNGKMKIESCLRVPNRRELSWLCIIIHGERRKTTKPSRARDGFVNSMKLRRIYFISIIFFNNDFPLLWSRMKYIPLAGRFASNTC